MQSDDNNNIERLDRFSLEVGKKLREHRMAVDPGLWEILSDRLPSRNRRFPAYWGWSAAGVAILLLGLLLFLNPFTDGPVIEMPQPIPDNGRKTELQFRIPVGKADIQKKDMTEAQQLFTQESSLQRQKMRKSESVVSRRISSGMGELTEKEHLRAETSLEEVPTPAEVVEQDKTSKSTVTEPDGDSAELLSAEDYPALPVHTKDSRLHSFLLALGSGNSLPDISPGEYDGSESFYYDNPVPGIGFSNDADAGRGEKYNLLTPGDFTEIMHHLPVTISLTTDFPVGNNVSLETGLSYTYLFSRFRRNDQLVYRGTLQQHYIGVPLNLRYQMWQNDSWTLYLLGGATVEKGIRSIYKQEIEEQGNVVHHTHVYNRIAGLQFSAQGGAGFSYRLQNNLHLFGEPRLLYYFRNNQPMSARTENPLIFGLNIGVRIQFK
jgi:hypothetical protein